MSINAQKVLENRYLRKNSGGKITETPEKLFKRVSTAVAEADLLYDQSPVDNTINEFYEAMSQLEFLPNSPTLMNAGTPLNQLAACFVLPVGDSLTEIFDALKNMALIHQSGGGVGFSFSKLRPKEDVVRTTHGVSSGPVSFLKIFDVTTEVIKQGGKRRGANMALLDVKHPDIVEFITSKEDESQLKNFNLSVAVDDEFMSLVKQDKEYHLINPRNRALEKKIKAKDIFDLVVEMAWKRGDPGIIFLDEINRANPTPLQGKIESTNPCGEQPLLPYESCNLGSINLAQMVDKNKINWNKLKTINIAVHFLDNVVDASHHPLPKIKMKTLENRKIGLGVMGFAEMLIKLDIPYYSNKALETADKIMGCISHQSREA